MRSYFAASLLTVAAGCSATMPVTARLGDGSETFTGSGQAGLTTGAPFTMVSGSNGATCTGGFDMKSLTGGSGAFTCDDGRSGSFNWTSSGARLSGVGTISGKPITITMG